MARKKTGASPAGKPPERRPLMRQPELSADEDRQLVEQSNAALAMLRAREERMAAEREKQSPPDPT